MSGQTSMLRLVPACSARSCARTESSSSISVDPARKYSGGRPRPVAVQRRDPRLGARRARGSTGRAAGRPAPGAEHRIGVRVVAHRRTAAASRSVAGDSSTAQSGSGSPRVAGPHQRDQRQVAAGGIAGDDAAVGRRSFGQRAVHGEAVVDRRAGTDVPAPAGSRPAARACRWRRTSVAANAAYSAGRCTHQAPPCR